MRLVTTDLRGNVASSMLNIGMLSGLYGGTKTLEGEVGSLQVGLAEAARQTNGRIAAAIALGGTLLPPDSNFAISFNIATYRREQGLLGAATARVSDFVYLSGGFAGPTVKGSTGGPVGLAFGW